MSRLQSAVYAPDRLRQRLMLFEEFTLPSMVSAARRYPFFRYIVLISPDLPDYYRAKLQSFVVAHGDWFNIRTIMSNENFHDAVRQSIAQSTEGTRGFNFRIDDDDALRPEFLERILEVSNHHAGDTIVSFDVGYYVQRLSDMRFRVHMKRYPQIAIGLGVFYSRNNPSSIFDQGVHGKIASGRIVSIEGEPYWIRTCHAFNDSGKRAEDDAAITLSEACKKLASGFAYLSIERALLALPETELIGEDVTAVRALYHIQ